jgi:DNA adenine methylase
LTAEPFLRWAGGKRWLARRIAPLVKLRLSGVYREPFLGGGSMFFATEPPRAVLSDLNSELISAWVQVRDNPYKLLALIRALPIDGETYYKVRAERVGSDIDRASRFIYLNRCCYGGLYRTNRRGEFNVPFGGGSRNPAPLWEGNQLGNASKAMRDCDLNLRTADFAAALIAARHGDVCFLDPTYMAATRGPFDRYNPKLFTWDDQFRLRHAARAAAKRGAVVVMSNVDCPEIRQLYSDELAVPLTRSKAIGNAVRNSRSKHELLIIYDAPEWHAAWARAAIGDQLFVSQLELLPDNPPFLKLLVA